MTKPRIIKASLKQGDFVVMIEHYDKDTESATTIKCKPDKLHPDLHAALRALSPEVREIIGLPSNVWMDGEIDCVRPSGVSWFESEGTGVEGACIIFQVDLETSNSPFCSNTPSLPFEQYVEDGEAPLMPDGAQDAIRKFRAEVHAFLEGKRAPNPQADMFADNSNEPDPEATAA